ncbi:MAG: hypothetical protein C0391_05500 [Anaerolinea sp.]|nr:hypothetical protein [Anaerolinea sp.]
MPDLLQSLLDQDIGYLQIIASTWGVDAPQSDSLPERAALVRRLLEPYALRQVLADLPENAAQALAELQQNKGRQLWTTFTRKYGVVREFGTGRRDREQPHLNPISPAEVLWYRALISRAFFKKSGLPQEFAFIPSDLLELLPLPAAQAISPPRIPLPIPGEYLPASCGDQILDHACTSLALLRVGKGTGHSNHLPITTEHSTFVENLLHEAGLLDVNGQPAPEAVKEHLESPRASTWSALYTCWAISEAYDDLLAVPDLQLEQVGSRFPLNARKAMLDHLRSLPAEAWLSIQGSIEYLMDAHPEFLRPDGNFDTWQIRSTQTGEYLNGFHHWEDVEGVYIRHLITGPLFWLGVVSTGYSSHARIPTVFKITPIGQALLHGELLQTIEENGRIIIKAGAQIHCPPLVPRWVRYLMARMADWELANTSGYAYRFTPGSLGAARKQALHISHLTSLLRKYGAIPPPPTLIRALQSWEENGTRVSLEGIQVLRVASPDILQHIMASRAARYLAEPLGPTAVMIKPGSAEKLSNLLIDLGYLGEIKTAL